MRETADMAKLIARIRDRGITVLIVEHDMQLVMNISTRSSCSPTARRSPTTVRGDPAGPPCHPRYLEDGCLGYRTLARDTGV